MPWGSNLTLDVTMRPCLVSLDLGISPCTDNFEPREDVCLTGGGPVSSSLSITTNCTPDSDWMRIYFRRIEIYRV